MFSFLQLKAGPRSFVEEELRKLQIRRGVAGSRAMAQHTRAHESLHNARVRGGMGRVEAEGEWTELLNKCAFTEADAGDLPDPCVSDDETEEEEEEEEEEGREEEEQESLAPGLPPGPDKDTGDDTADPDQVVSFVGLAQVPCGYQILDSCPRLETDENMQELIGMQILHAWDNKDRQRWFEGTVQGLNLNKVDCARAPTANFAA